MRVIVSSSLKWEFVRAPIKCFTCGKPAKCGWKLGSKVYAKSCAADMMGVTLTTLNEMQKKYEADVKGNSTGKASKESSTDRAKRHEATHEVIKRAANNMTNKYDHNKALNK